MTQPPPRSIAAERRSTAHRFAAVPESVASADRRARPGAARALFVLATLAGAALTTACTPASTCGEADTLENGQQKIDEGRYEEAIDVYSCVLEADPASVDAYRGRAEAELMLGLYSDAYRDMYANVIAAVQPADIVSLGDQIIASYDARLAEDPGDLAALRGCSFARWSYFQYDGALPLLDELLAREPNDVFARLFRGSNRLFSGADVDGGRSDMDEAIALDPENAHVRYVVSDAYTYAYPDAERAYSEADLALQWGLDTPRVRAILGAALDQTGDRLRAAYQVEQHIELVTTSRVGLSALAAGSSVRVDLVPGKTFRIPIEATAGETIKISTGSSSPNVWDSILVLFSPNGAPVVSNDDDDGFFAGLDWVAPASGTYTLRVTGFEAIFTGPLDVTRE